MVIGAGLIGFAIGHYFGSTHARHAEMQREILRLLGERDRIAKAAKGVWIDSEGKPMVKQETPKRKPTRSSVMKMPKPQEIREAKAKKEAEQFTASHEGGTFAL